MKVVTEQYTIYNEDCLKVMPTLEKVDLLLTDPPYAASHAVWDTLDWLDTFFDVIPIREDTPILIFCNDILLYKLLLKYGQYFRYNYIWIKQKGSGHLNIARAPIKKTEYVAVFFNKCKVFNHIYKRQLLHKNIKERMRPRVDAFTPNKIKPSGFTGFTNNVLMYNEEVPIAKIHSFQKPVALLEQLIKTYTNEGSIVFDPFMGSGTCGVACINTNRKFIGIERDKTYFDIASNYLSNHVVLNSSKLFSTI